ncbi:arp2/3 complex-activating protein rickA [Manihot esculenta]|uniref:Vegetative cell wall protein gp1-like n=1 Tax=Manihot esculenta TaxID=3983 RepID=A0A2C9VUP4_MANES|nr:arp2/3 complex-activating protein rickA [Manihot esculenta]OAY48964.1 hypothetical protein MANES_05G019100v8 [Manihot esculenta]
MANQSAPPRPWFRLPSIARPVPEPAPTPAPEPAAPQPRPPLARPAFRPAGESPSPPTQPQGPTPARPGGGVGSVPTSPALRASAPSASLPTSPARTTTARVPSPEPSPRTIKPSVQSPPQVTKPKPTTPPPSPLILPSAKIRAEAGNEAMIPLEAEQKTVLVQKTIDKPKPLPKDSDSERNLVDALKTSISQDRKQEASKDAQTKEKGQRKKTSPDSKDRSMRVITIAGENKGAFMEVTRSPNKKHVFEGNQWRSYSSSGEEGKPKMKDEGHKGRTVAYTPMGAFINSNVQGVNNSILYESSCTLHDPGVHLAISTKPPRGWFHIKDDGH